MHLVLSRVSWWVQLSKGVGFHWNFMPITPRPNKNDLSRINTTNKLYFHTSIIVPIKKLHYDMNANLYQSPPLYKEHIWLERVDVSNFLKISSQHQLHKQLELDTVFHLCFHKCWDNDINISLSTGNIFDEITQVCICLALFLLTTSHWELMKLPGVSKYIQAFFFLTVVFSWWISSI